MLLFALCLTTGVAAGEAGEPSPPPSEALIDSWIARLGDADPAVSSNARAQLLTVGAALRPRLRLALTAGTGTPAIRRAARSLLNDLPQPQREEDLRTGTPIDIDLPAATLVEALQAVERQAEIRLEVPDYRLMHSSVKCAVKIQGNYWEALRSLAQTFVPAIDAGPPPPPNPVPPRISMWGEDATTYYRVTPLREEQIKRDRRPRVVLCNLRQLAAEPLMICGPVCVHIQQFSSERDLATGQEVAHLKLWPELQPGFALAGDWDWALADSTLNGVVVGAGLVLDPRTRSNEHHLVRFHCPVPAGGLQSMILLGRLRATLSDCRQMVEIDPQSQAVGTWKNQDARIVAMPGSRVPHPDNLKPDDAPLPAAAHPQPESSVLLRTWVVTDLNSSMYNALQTGLRCEDKSGLPLSYTPRPGSTHFYSAGQGRASVTQQLLVEFPPACVRLRVLLPGPRTAVNFPLRSPDLATLPLLPVHLPPPDDLAWRVPAPGPLPETAPLRPAAPAGETAEAWQKTVAACEQLVTRGSQVHLDLKDAPLATALAAIEQQAGCDLREYLWKHRSVTTRKTLQFDGTFWEALQKVLREYLGANPPQDGYGDVPMEAGAAKRLADYRHGYDWPKPNSLVLSLDNFELGAEPTQLTGAASLRVLKLRRNRDFEHGTDRIECAVEIALDPQVDAQEVRVQATLTSADGLPLPPSTKADQYWSDSLYALLAPLRMLSFDCPAPAAGQPLRPFAFSALRLKGALQVTWIGTTRHTFQLPADLGSSLTTAYGKVYLTRGEDNLFRVLDGHQEVATDADTAAAAADAEAAKPSGFHSIALIAAGRDCNLEVLKGPLLHDIQLRRRGELLPFPERGGMCGGGGGEQRFEGIQYKMADGSDQLTVRLPVVLVPQEIPFDFQALRAPGAPAPTPPAPAPAP